jgi:hypothetical protein
MIERMSVEGFYATVLACFGPGYDPRSRVSELLTMVPRRESAHPVGFAPREYIFWLSTFAACGGRNFCTCNQWGELRGIGHGASITGRQPTADIGRGGEEAQLC